MNKKIVIAFMFMIILSLMLFMFVGCNSSYHQNNDNNQMNDNSNADSSGNQSTDNNSNAKDTVLDEGSKIENTNDEECRVQYEKKYASITQQYNLSLQELESQKTSLENKEGSLSNAIEQTRINLANLPSQEQSYIKNRINYWRYNSPNTGSVFWRELATRDWENYYVQKKSEYNSMIIQYQASLKTCNDEIAEVNDKIGQLKDEYASDITSLQIKYGLYYEPDVE